LWLLPDSSASSTEADTDGSSLRNSKEWLPFENRKSQIRRSKYINLRPFFDLFKML
jgi:hypothetical protein